MLFIFLLFALTTQSLQGSSVRYRRQGYYYICGTYPDQYYAIYPCNYNPSPLDRLCANGGNLVGIGCASNIQCSPFSPSSVCIAGCCCTTPTAPATTASPVHISQHGYCYNGERSQMRCSSIMECSSGQTCINGLCCKTTGDEWKNACAGLTALASCTNGSCGSFFCTSSNYCCECEFGRTSGPCSNSECGPGFSCSENDYCCPTCPNGEAPYGSCYTGLCAAGYSCRSGNICCP